MRINQVLLCFGVMLLTGCSVFSPAGSGDFACPGMPRGVTCKSPREVYDMSINKQSKKSKSSGYNPSPVEVTIARQGGALPPIPVLEQALVMRIWISPWKDDNTDLHWPGLIFTQVQSRQWTIGESDFNGVEPPVPHRFTEKPVAIPGQVEKGVMPTANREAVLN